MSFTIFGTKVSVSVPFTVVLAFMLISDKTGLMSASLLAVILHEVGHLSCMKFLKCQPQSVKLSASGILICGTSFCTFKDSILIAFSGPFINFLFTALFWLIGKYIGSFIMLSFAAVQFLVGFINILPVKGLDGGTLIFNLLSKFQIRNAGLINSFISIFFSCAVLVFGIAVAVRNVGNPSLLLLGIYLTVLNVMKR